MERIYDGAQTRSLAMLSASDDDLTIEVSYLPAQDSPEGLIIMTLGVHGVEAFAGSAVMQMFSAEILPQLNLANTSIMFVHAVNPWGFRHKRRVNENNVDLNRNMSVSANLFATVNQPYGDIDSFLNPTQPVTAATVENSVTDALVFAVDYPRDELQQAILQGQYDFPLGIFYGGDAFEPSHQLLDPLFLDAVEQHRKVFLMDFHTGFGERSKLHLFGAPGLGTPAAMDAVFAGYEIDTGENDENFYETYGDMIVYLGEMAAKADRTYLGMTMEYGTLDSHTDLGAVRSLVNTKLENQGFHHGYSDDAVKTNVEQTFLEGYYPVEAEWRSKIMTETRAMLPILIERFAAL